MFSYILRRWIRSQISDVDYSDDDWWLLMYQYIKGLNVLLTKWPIPAIWSSVNIDIFFLVKSSKILPLSVSKCYDINLCYQLIPIRNDDCIIMHTVYTFGIDNIITSLIFIRCLMITTIFASVSRKNHIFCNSACCE